MTRNRVIPFGYHIHNGQLAIKTSEAQVVQTIFSQYIGGSSYKMLAGRLSAGDVPYRKDGPHWNKNMIKRILETPRYLGTEEYPAIVSRETFTQAAAMQATKTQGYTPPPPWVKMLRGRVHCLACGDAMLRDTRLGHGRWCCPGNADHPPHAISDESLAALLTTMLNALAKVPRLVEIPATELGIVSSETICMDNEVQRLCEKRGCDESAAISLALAAAAARYALCDDGAAAIRAREIRERLGDAHLGKAFDNALFEQIAKTAHIHPDGSIGITLLTGQYIIKATQERKNPA